MMVMLNIERTLEKTKEMMTDADYRVRFAAEYWQAKARYEKLKDFCNHIEASRIAIAATGKMIDVPKHDCPLDMLREQQRIMGEYLKILELRAIIEDVDVNGMIVEKCTNTFEGYEFY